MDPNANLQAQQRIVTVLLDPGMHVGAGVSREALERLAELRAALSGWLSAGGFAPDWDACPEAARVFGHGPLTVQACPHCAPPAKCHRHAAPAVAPPAFSRPR